MQPQPIEYTQPVQYTQPGAIPQPSQYQQPATQYVQTTQPMQQFSMNLFNNLVTRIAVVFSVMLQFILLKFNKKVI